MNKFKLFFTAAAVFAVVGSALAVKPTFEGRFCRRAPQPNGTCPNIACAGAPITRDLDPAGGTSDCYRQVAPQVTDCSTVTCPNLGRLIVEGQ